MDAKYIDKRHIVAIHNAVNKIKCSKIFSDISTIVLYGSCARGNAKYDSDVDLLIIMPKRAIEKNHEEIIWLKGLINDGDVSDPEIDLHFANNEEWVTRNDTYAVNIKKEGVVLWRK